LRTGRCGTDSAPTLLESAPQLRTGGYLLDFWGIGFDIAARFEKYLGYAVAAFELDGYGPREELTYVSYSQPGKQAARFALRGDRTLILRVFAEDHAEQAIPDSRPRGGASVV
jgi:hypothetical protein